MAASEQISQSKLGQYTLLEKIAQGGMAQVFKAKTIDPTGIERLVVIKRILPHVSSQPEYVDMLVSEAKIAVQFTHGNIAQIYDLGRVGEDYFIVMEYVDGKTFSHMFKALAERHQKFPLDVLLYCFIEICHGLSYIHNKMGAHGEKLGVIHRDISPQNIILTYAGNVKIIDFGVAKADFIEGQTEHGVLKGKFAYMSPEQTKAGKLDYRSDIFSLGTLLWEMLTGERLFKRKSNKETVQAVQKAKFDLPSVKRADIPKALDKIVKKALSKSPRFRYQDARDMAQDLEKLLFKINPDFRPILAAKYLYDLFGPGDGEEELTPPFFVKSKVYTADDSPTNHSQRSQSKFSIKKVVDDITVKTMKRKFDDMTPIVAVGQKKAREIKKWFLVALVLVVFLWGSSYVYHVHQLRQKAYLTFIGADENMTVLINDRPIKNFEDAVEIKAEKNYLIEIQKEGYKTFVKKIKLRSLENKIVQVRLKKDVLPFGDLVIDTIPQGATVYLDDKEKPEKTPMSMKSLDSGKKYIVGLYLDDHKFVKKEVFIEAGKQVKIKVPLPVDYATLKVTTEPTDAAVYLDGKLLGHSPIDISKVLPGEKRILEIKKIGMTSLKSIVTFKGGESKFFHYDLVKEEDDNAKTPSSDSVNQNPLNKKKRQTILTPAIEPTHSANKNTKEDFGPVILKPLL